MRITLSKILNKTDLAQSGSHGGLVVTKSEQTALKVFFEVPGKDQKFIDKSDNEEFQIHYQDYTSNGTTPNDRITPIGKYATKHGLQPGDILVLDCIDSPEKKDYFIEYARRLGSAFFAGKSRVTVDVLNYDQLMDVLNKNISLGSIKKVSNEEFEMTVQYLGTLGTLNIKKSTEGFELCFNGISISENNKYFELDTAALPFLLKKTNTWCVAMDADYYSDIKANLEADAELIAGLFNFDNSTKEVNYVAKPENKAPEVEHKGRKVPARSRAKAENALRRANYKCEVGDHETFLRKNSLIPYTEPHHLIPLQYDDQFEYSLDVEANIVSLCSGCHNQLHYGACIEKIIRQLWDQRKGELEAAGLLKMKSGIEMTVELLLSFYGVH